ncbi:type IV toxin-antitoxin system AbiEi family antitoxin domain-containing protein [Bifidobacterium callitrichidarum]|uniref:CTP synthase n=1 Tax=Bifidobacterium callitrichidarum TaxID=2052941 RepID=A0A2U2N0P6_9BIFI|nr:CTP synthase [Bifidobacterium callitrichidarum]PWG62549.1 CTP synthase [Bifidobacterium callitrichidarum]
MKTHHIIADKLAQAQQRGSCVFAANIAEGKALRRRVRAGELVSPYRGIFVRADYWDSLNDAERAQHLARCLAARYPSWVFAGPTAAALYGFDHQWSIHRAGLYLASTDTSRPGANGIRHIFMSEIPLARVQGVQVTSVDRTLVDCALILPFASALPIFDSAFRRGVCAVGGLRSLCAGLRRDTSAINRLLEYVDPLSENGGESSARAVMIEEGFPVPQLQRVFEAPGNPGEWYRVDFAWSFPGGYTIVAEYDGMVKYTDPAMTGHRSIQAVVNQQGEREHKLYEWGVSRIVRLSYDDVMRRQPLIDKLCAAGLPRNA